MHLDGVARTELGKIIARVGAFKHVELVHLRAPWELRATAGRDTNAIRTRR
jgi:hypothetical protein